MILQDLFDQLALGELSQHKIGKTGKIQDADITTIITHLNGGLTNLHSYFPLAEREVIVREFDHITEYRINSKYAESNTESLEPYKWVVDTDYQPFGDDIIRIEGIFNEVGDPIPLNDTQFENAIFTTAWDTLQIPFPNSANVISIIYRAKHLTVAPDADPMTTEILVPPVLEEALRSYIAGRCFVSMGSQSSGGLASYYSNRYQEQVAHVETFNLLRSSDTDVNNKLTQKGFL